MKLTRRDFLRGAVVTAAALAAGVKGKAAGKTQENMGTLMGLPIYATEKPAAMPDYDIVLGDLSAYVALYGAGSVRYGISPIEHWRDHPEELANA